MNQKSLNISFENIFLSYFGGNDVYWDLFITSIRIY
jgi:hypothetical protein